MPHDARRSAAVAGHARAGEWACRCQPAPARQGRGHKRPDAALSFRRLLAELVGHLARNYCALLDAAEGGTRATSRRDLLARVLALGNQAAAQPYQLVWWDIVAGSARDVPGYRAAAAAVIDHMLAWLAAQMPPGDPDPAGGARHLLTLIEGAQMLAAAGHRETALAALAEAGLLP
jgi:hypothetical protein